ncbi:MAG: biotin--[acetyl-CoA-carboxylase] ligase [Thermodesulfobacteriota bacterium]
MVTREAAEVEIIRLLRAGLLGPDAEGYTSGQRLSDGLGISRTAVWKHINSLKKMGFPIEASPSKGYRLRSGKSPFNPVEVASLLETGTIGRRIFFYPELASTNVKAFELGRGGEPEGTAVIADAQSRGKGRIGREWVSPPGVNLYTSIILRPEILPRDAYNLTFLLAVSVAEAVSSLCASGVTVKWPNDVLIGGRKAAGILLEMDSEADRVYFVVAGVGVNLNMDKGMFPARLRPLATSVAAGCGSDVDRAGFVRDLYSALEKWYKVYLGDGFAPVLKAWKGYFASEGKPVKVVSFNRVVTGICLGVGDDGALLVRTPCGTVERVISGDVEPAG